MVHILTIKLERKLKILLSLDNLSTINYGSQENIPTKFSTHIPMELMMQEKKQPLR